MKNFKIEIQIDGKTVCYNYALGSIEDAIKFVSEKGNDYKVPISAKKTNSHADKPTMR